MILLMGRTGAGKSSAAAELARRHSELKWIALGEVLRHSRVPEVVSALKSGELVRDQLVTQVVIKAIKGLAPGQVPLLDGFPRRLHQITQLELSMPALHRKLKRVFYIKISPQTATARLIRRHRADDAPAIIQRRVEIFENETLPVVEYYRRHGIVSEIDGENSIDHVVKQIETVLGY